MYLVYSQNPAGSHVSCVLTISPLFPICFPSFWSHSHHLSRLSVAGYVAHHQLSSRVSYKSFSAVAGPVWLEHLIRQLSFLHFQSRSAPPQQTPQLLVPLLVYRDWAHQHLSQTLMFWPLCVCPISVFLFSLFFCSLLIPGTFLHC